MTWQTKGLLGVALACLATYALLLGLDGTGSLGIASISLLVGLVSAAVAIILDSLGNSPLRRVAIVTVWCILGFGVGYLPYWYLWHTYASQPLPAFRVSFPRRAAAGMTSGVSDGTQITSSHAQTRHSSETHAAVPPCGFAVVRDVEALVIRRAPGVTTERIGSSARGTTVELPCAPPVEADGAFWRRVRTDGVEGWMSSRFLQLLGDA